MATLNIKSSKFFVIFALILTLCTLIYFAGKRGVADVYAYQTSAYVDLWQQKNTEIPPQDQWQAAFNSLSQAIQLVPEQSSYLESMSGLYQWQVLFLESTSDQIAALTLSKSFLKRAIELRPAWPYSWANYALIKHQLNEIDDEYFHALQQAIALGPWESKVQTIVAQAFLPHWNVFSEEMKTLLVENAFRSFHSKGNSFLQLAKQYHVFITLCTRMKRDDTIKQVCSDKKP